MVVRLVKALLAALAGVATALAFAILQNRPPLAASPGPAARVATYLRTGVAETTLDSPFPELRTRNYAFPASLLYAKVKEVVPTLPGWQIAATDDAKREVRAVVGRSFSSTQDDVTITVVPEPGGRPALVVRGAARDGGPDLGANTRHVLDLYDALAAAGVKGGSEG